MQIEGRGGAWVQHQGPCTTSSTRFPFLIGGRQEDQTLELEIAEELSEEGEALGPEPEVSDDLPAGCTLGDVIGEGFALTFGAIPPEVMEIDLETLSDTLQTESPVSPRVGTLEITIEKIEPNGS